MRFEWRDPHPWHVAPANSHQRAAQRLIFVDIETAGQQLWRPIIQIAAVAVDSNFRELESFEEKIRFNERDAVKWTLRKRHYNRRRWQQEARRDKDVAVDFAAFLVRHATVGAVSVSGAPFAVAQLVAHNAAFDAPFLRTWFERLGLFFPGTYRVYCTLHRAMWLFHEDRSLAPPDDFRLGTLCEYFGVSLPPEQAHDALADARATAKLYHAMRAGIPRSPTRLTHSRRKT
jgi:DNA polymerase III epsilon subunit-like protein